MAKSIKQEMEFYKDEVGKRLKLPADIDFEGLYPSIDHLNHRGNNEVWFLRWITNISAQCAAPAAGELLLRAFDGLRHVGGWTIDALPQRNKTTMEVTIQHFNLPGAWHLGVEFEPVLNEAGIAQKKIDDDLRKKRASGMSRKELVDEMLERLHASDSKEPDPDLYRTPRSGDRVSRIFGTGLKTYESHEKNGSIARGGVPPGTLDDATSYLSSFKNEGKVRNWWNGVSLNVRTLDLDADRSRPSFSPDGSNYFSGPRLLMCLNEIFQAEGLDHLVSEEMKQIDGLSFWSTDVGNDALLGEISLGLMSRNKGAMNQNVMDVIADFSSKLRASAVTELYGDFDRLFDALSSLGHTTEDNAYSCNDGRTVSFAVEDATSRMLFTETQGGRYLVESMEVQGRPSISTWIINPQSNDLAGLFFIDESGTAISAHDLSELPIEYSASNACGVVDMLSSLSSTLCVLDDSRDEPTP